MGRYTKEEEYYIGVMHDAYQEEQKKRTIEYKKLLKENKLKCPCCGFISEIPKSILKRENI